MTSLLRRHLFAACAAIVLAASATAQDDPKPPAKPDPELAKQFKQLGDAVKDPKFTRDPEAINLIDELKQRYEAMHEKDQQAFRGVLRDVFRGKKRKLDNPGLYRAASYALGDIGGPEAAKILVDVLGTEPFSSRDWLSFQEDLYENIGRTKDERQVAFLLKQAVREPEDQIKRAAGKALRHFEELPLAKRREIFKDLLTNYGEIESKANASLDTGDADMATAKRTLNAIRDAWNGTLSAMSGANCGTSMEWYKWYSDNKNKDKAWKN